jgi:hypothetical protein
MRFEISLGSATSAGISGHTTPAVAIADIQSGKWAKEITALRAATGDVRDRLKKLLPAFLWAGKFSTRKNDGVENFSGLICADVDKVAKRVGELHDIARNDPHAAAAFVSPSGMGIKIVFRVPVAADANEHQRNFAAVRAHVTSHYSAQVDEAAKDVARLCFVSHDPAAFYNADALPLEVNGHEVAPKLADTLPKNTAPRFAWDNQAGMHLSIESTADAKADAEFQELTELFQNVFASRPAMSHAELTTAVTKAVSVVPRTAERKIARADTLGIIRKTFAGLYEIRT